MPNLGDSQVTIRVSETVRREYEEILERCRVNKSESGIANLYPWHCKAAIGKLLDEAIGRQNGMNGIKDGGQTNVRILTSHCPDHVFGKQGVFPKLSIFLNAGGRLKILVWNKSDAEGIGGDIFSLQNPHATIRFSQTTLLAKEIQHFLVVDNNAYRLEQGHDPVEGQKFNDFYPEIKARICFNDPLQGEALVKFFDTLWERVGGTEE